jgi:predicted dehydrogenase
MIPFSDLLGVAVVGLGVGEQHAWAYHANSRCRVRWLYDLDVARADSLCQRLGTAQVAPSFDAVLDSTDVQIVSIATYDECHAEQVMRALGAGKHVFVEKPLCQSQEQLRMIKRAWEAHRGKVKLGCNLVLRSAPLYQWLKERLERGDFGKVYAFDGDYLYGRLEKIAAG